MPDDQRAARLGTQVEEAFEGSESLWGVFTEAVAAGPDTLALIGASDGASEGVRSWSYSALDAASHWVAARLVGSAAASMQGAPVAVMLAKGPEQVISVLAVLRAGGVYVPVSPDWPEARRAAIFEQAGIRHAIADGQTVLPEGVACVTLDGLAEGSGAADMPVLDGGGRGPADLAYIIFTSGSTGTPKGVMIEHGAVVNTLRDINARGDVGPGDRLFGLSSLAFDLSVYDIFGAFAAGATLVMPTCDVTRDPGAARAIAAGHGVTVWNSVPALMGLQLELDGPSGGTPTPLWPALRLVLLSGDWVPPEMPDHLRARGVARVWALGGATEASIWSNMHEVGSLDLTDWPSIPYGTALTNQRMDVRGADMMPCPDWVTGEICIAGQGLARGYCGDPDKTAAAFVTAPDGARIYRTGDLGRIRPGGVIEFLGRRDRQVKIAGNRIELGDIEAALRAHPDIRAAAATPVRQNTSLAAAIVPVKTTADRVPQAATDAARTAGRAAAAMLPDGFDPDAYTRFAQALDAAATVAIETTLAQCGLFTAKDERLQIPDAIVRAAIDPRFERLVTQWCDALGEDGKLDRTGA
ncbi:MAG: amino acid adenylation domain-containing protein, partial [Oceanicola sp.]|nr:amino acid adenylation domain-containing protein [Oceanicola sp.]